MTATTTTTSPGPRRDAARHEVLGLCVRGSMAQLRRREERLGGLCAEGVVNVLDGAVLHHDAEPDQRVQGVPAVPGVRGVRFRPLQNLPRSGALSEALWAGVCRQLSGTDSHTNSHTAAQTDRSSRDLLVAHTGSLSDLVHLLVAVAEPIAPGESALIVFLDGQAGFEYRDLFSDIAGAADESHHHTAPTRRQPPTSAAAGLTNTEEQS